MYELMILALLMRGPAHGYNIAKIMNDLIGPAMKVSHGSLYPRLRRLQEEELISASEVVEEARGESGTQPNTRQTRIYSITEAGRRHFRDLMMDTTSNPGEYSRVFWLKAAYLDCLHPAEQLELIDHYLNYCQTHQLYLKAVTKNVVESKSHYRDMTLAQLELTLHALHRAASQWQVEAEYAGTLREKVLAKMLVE